MPIEYDWPFTSTTSTTAGTIWVNWASNSTTASTWTAWVTAGGTITFNETGQAHAVGGYVDPAPRQLSEEERRVRAERDEVARQRAKRLREQADEAKVRASELLRSILTDEQWDAWVKDSAFDLTTEAGHQYRIKRGTAGNVYRIEDGKQIESLCIHPRTSIYDDDRQYLGDLPVEDVIITQKLNLEADEAEFRRIANITRLDTYSMAMAA
jgi:hypothetical protein